MKKLEGKVAVVTGASRGIGAEIARLFAAEGAAVVVNYSKSAEKAQIVVDEIVTSGGKAVAIAGDVGSPEGATAFAEAAVAAFGPIDVLVNNAGIAEFGNVEQYTEEHIQQQFNVNVYGLLRVIHALAPHINEGGSIINVSSIVGSVPVPGAAVYSSTKAAVDGITKSLARELGPRKIRVNAVAPGPVVTDMYTGVADTMSDYFISRTPLGRIGETADIAKPVLFLASDDAAWITGEILNVGGGLLP